jgi:hypothetical protein
MDDKRRGTLSLFAAVDAAAITRIYTYAAPIGGRWPGGIAGSDGVKSEKSDRKRHSSD